MKRRTLVFLVVAAALADGCSKQSESLTIAAGVSLHSGTTIQQVVAELGHPDQTKPGAFDYSHLGLEVAPGYGGGVQRVTIRAPSTGRIKEGIGIGASRADVIQALGAPTFDKPGSPGYEFLRYTKIPSGGHLVFQLHNGKVDVISVFFRDTK